MAIVSARRTGLLRLVPSIPARVVRHHAGVTGEPVDRADVGEVATGLRRLLAAIESGDVTAGPGEAARLEGALMAMEAVQVRIFR
jgi:hypothetical protein